MKTTIAVTSVPTERPTQGMTISSEILIVTFLGIAIAIVGGLLKRSIDSNDQRIKNAEIEIVAIEKEVVQLKLDLVEMKGNCLKQDDIHRIEAMIGSLHRRIDELLMEKRNHA